MSDQLVVKEPVSERVESLLDGNANLRKTSLTLLGLPIAGVLSAPVLPLFLTVRLAKRITGTGDDLFKGAEPGHVQREASKTAVLVAACRYVGYREGWTNDRMSRHFLPFELKMAIENSLYFSKLFQITLKLGIGYFMARTLAGDRLIENLKPKQIVLLGAGLDTRAHRLKLVEGCRFYEIDIASTQALKKKITAKYPGEFIGHVTYIPVDFSCENFMDKLLATPGFDPTCPETLILFEGVTMYLEWEALSQTMESISKNLAPGTIVGMDCVKDMVNTKEARQHKWKLRGGAAVVWFVKHIGEPFRYGIPLWKTANDIFPQLGFKVLADLTHEQIEPLFFAPTKANGEKKKPIGKFPRFGHYIILKVSPPNAV